jgi:hypothetical protein
MSDPQLAGDFINGMGISCGCCELIGEHVSSFGNEVPARVSADKAPPCPKKGLALSSDFRDYQRCHTLIFPGSPDALPAISKAGFVFWGSIKLRFARDAPFRGVR